MRMQLNSKPVVAGVGVVALVFGLMLGLQGAVGFDEGDVENTEAGP